MDQSDSRAGVKAVIFDLDGTLIDTLDDITDSLNVVFETFGYAPVSRTRARLLIGEGLTRLLELASGQTDSNHLTELVDRYRAEYRDRMFERTRLYDGVAKMLDRLVERRIPMCVLSNKSDEFTVPIGTRLLGRWPFVAMRGSVPEVPRKPDPIMALELIALMNGHPEESIFVGDSEIDIETGRNAGMRTVGVTWGFRDRNNLERAVPNALLDAPNEVAQWILDS